LRRILTQIVILLLLSTTVALRAQGSPPHVIVHGVWFLTGDTNGYSNTVVIEMRDYLIVVDANYPGRAKELLGVTKQLSPKPVRYVFDTHAHGDHAYGNSVWTAAGATTLAFQGVTDEMNRWEPTRWRNAMASRADVRATGETDVQRPQMSITGDKLVLNDGTREVDFLFLGWGHTPGDGYVWLPAEKILATGDAAVNGPRNKLLDANIANWPKALERARAGAAACAAGARRCRWDRNTAGAEAVSDRSVRGGEGAGGRGEEAGGDADRAVRAGQRLVSGGACRSAPAGHRDGVPGDHIARTGRLGSTRVEIA
jgi:glyoxylase-like metal-dependent hydrolase (beta-lactamase superfamily II)